MTTSRHEGMLRDWIILDVEATPEDGWIYDREYPSAVLVNYVPHVWAIAQLGTPENVELVLRARRDAPRYASALRAIFALDPADAATSSRDYGRGYSQALRDVCAAIDRALDGTD